MGNPEKPSESSFHTHHRPDGSDAPLGLTDLSIEEFLEYAVDCRASSARLRQILKTFDIEVESHFLPNSQVTTEARAAICRLKAAADAADIAEADDDW